MVVSAPDRYESVFSVRFWKRLVFGIVLAGLIITVGWYAFAVHMPSVDAPVVYSEQAADNSSDEIVKPPNYNVSDSEKGEIGTNDGNLGTDSSLSRLIRNELIALRNKPSGVTTSNAVGLQYICDVSQYRSDVITTIPQTKMLTIYPTSLDSGMVTSVAQPRCATTWRYKKLSYAGLLDFQLHWCSKNWTRLEMQSFLSIATLSLLTVPNVSSKSQISSLIRQALLPYQAIRIEELAIAPWDASQSIWLVETGNEHKPRLERPSLEYLWLYATCPAGKVPPAHAKEWPGLPKEWPQYNGHVPPPPHSPTVVIGNQSASCGSEPVISVIEKNWHSTQKTGRSDAWLLEYTVMQDMGQWIELLQDQNVGEPIRVLRLYWRRLAPITPNISSPLAALQHAEAQQTRNSPWKLVPVTLEFAHGMDVDGEGNLWVSDTGSASLLRIQNVSSLHPQVERITLIGNASMCAPHDLKVHAASNWVYVLDSCWYARNAVFIQLARIFGFPHNNPAAGRQWGLEQVLYARGMDIQGDLLLVADSYASFRAIGDGDIAPTSPGKSSLVVIDLKTRMQGRFTWMKQGELTDVALLDGWYYFSFYAGSNPSFCRSRSLSHFAQGKCNSLVHLLPSQAHIPYCFTVIGDSHMPDQQRLFFSTWTLSGGGRQSQLRQLTHSQCP